MVSVSVTTETADAGTAVTWTVDVSVTVEVIAVPDGDIPAIHEVVPFATSKEKMLAVVLTSSRVTKDVIVTVSVVLPMAHGRDEVVALTNWATAPAAPPRRTATSVRCMMSENALPMKRW